MPARIVVSLQPASPKALPPPQTGPAVNAAVLKAVGDIDAGLATVLHDSRSYKPFSITTVLDEQGEAPSTPGQAAQFTVSLLVDAHTAPVLDALSRPAGYQICATRYHNAGVVLAAAQSYEDIARTAAPRVSWDFEILTPVSFATARGDGARRQHPWPDPDRVFVNLANRWHAYAPQVPLPDAACTAIVAHLETTGGQLSITEHLVEPHQRVDKHRYRRGAVGTVGYELAQADVVAPAGRCALDALATFATYAGFGDRTAMGMGHVRLLPPGAGQRLGRS